MKRYFPFIPWLPLAVLGEVRPPQEGDWEALGREWWAHVRVLADDNMEGRDTGSPGFDRAADYVAGQFSAAGLEPAGVAGFRQPVDFHLTQLDLGHSAVELVRDGTATPLRLGDHAALVVSTKTPTEVEAEAIFVGYGLSIPELGYDDLAGLDLRGKVAVLVRGGPTNLPGAIKAHFQSAEERHKILRKAGAVGAVSILNPTVADLPWPRLSSGLHQARLELSDPGPDGYVPLPLVMVFNHEHADVLFAGSGHSFREVTTGLGSDQALPRFPLAVKFRAHVEMTRRDVRCHNLAGVLPGRDPELKSEYVVVSAHLDHLGIGEAINGDSIYNGALDNAAGVGALLQLARGITSSATFPKRSTLFLVVTGEERGLLGSEYFAAHPTVKGPIVANVNLDGLLPLCAFKHMEIQGLEESSLGDDIRVVGRESGVEIHSEYEPDRVLFIRSDQYPFIKQGVPALFPLFGYLRGSSDEDLFRAWTRDRYHAPSDDLDQPVDLPAAAQFNAVMQKLVERVGNATTRPAWKPDSFFRRFAK